MTLIYQPGHLFFVMLVCAEHSDTAAWLQDTAVNCLIKLLLHQTQRDAIELSSAYSEVLPRQYFMRLIGAETLSFT